MSKQLRSRIAYWFFLILGMVALVNQYFIQGWIHAWYVEILKTLLFGIFALRPLVLIEIQRSISTYFINKSKKGNNNDNKPETTNPSAKGRPYIAGDGIDTDEDL